MKLQHKTYFIFIKRAVGIEGIIFTTQYSVIVGKNHYEIYIML